MKHPLHANPNRGWRRWSAAGAVLAASLFAATPARAIDVDAGDYTALPAGTTLGITYYQHATRNRAYSGGDRVPINARLDSDVGILRGVRFMDIGGYIVDPQFLLPFGKLKGKNDLSALGSADGIGDLLLAATVWFNKPGQKENFGITPFVFVPVGSYDRNKPLNLGENRWKFALQAGWINPLSDSITMDLIGDVTLFGENDKFGASKLKQKPLLQFQGWWRYHLSAATDLRLGLSQTVGGETKVDGVSQDDRTSTSKFSIGAGHFVGATTQILATYGRDISVREGLKENNRLNLRLLLIF
jgi:Putative MetA-pathway of phenol degradation